MLMACCSTPFVMVLTGSGNGSVGGPDVGTFICGVLCTGGLNWLPGYSNHNIYFI